MEFHPDQETSEALADLIHMQAYSACQSARLVKEKYPDGREFWTFTAWVSPAHDLLKWPENPLLVEEPCAT